MSERKTTIMTPVTGIYCSSVSFGGLEMNTIRLANWFSKDGKLIKIFLRKDSPMHKNALEKNLPVRAFEKRGVFALKQWIQKEKIDVLILPYNKDLKIASACKRWFLPKLKIIYQQHMGVGVNKKDLIHSLRYKMIDAWIAPLNYLKEEVLQKTNVPERKIFVIPIGLDIGSFLNGLNKAKARQLLSLSPKAEIIGMLGRIDPKKGQDIVIRAIHKLREDYSLNYYLLIVGDATLNESDTYAKSLQQLITDLKIRNYIIMQPYRQDVVPFFKAIDIFAIPSHDEAYGMVTLEAMLSKVPVIGTDSYGTKELLQNGKFGYPFKLNDVDDFCNCVLQVRNENELDKKLLTAQQNVIQNFSYKKMLAEFYKVIQLVISK